MLTLNCMGRATNFLGLENIILKVQRKSRSGNKSLVLACLNRNSGVKYKTVMSQFTTFEGIFK